MIKSVTAILNRRALLLGLASASTAAAGVATASVAVATAAPAEDPTLLALGDKVSTAVARFTDAREDARAIYAYWSPKMPAAPDAICVYWGDTYERDLAGASVQRANRFGEMRTVRMLSAGELETRLADWRRHLQRARSDKRREEVATEVAELSELLEIASAYEVEREAVVVASGYREARKLREDAEAALLDLVGKIMDERAVSMTGIVIKADALNTVSRALGSSGFFHSQIDRAGNVSGPASWGQKLAADMIEVGTVAAANARA